MTSPPDWGSSPNLPAAELVIFGLFGVERNRPKRKKNWNLAAFFSFWINLSPSFPYNCERYS
jgi:hypothetical protein